MAKIKTLLESTNGGKVFIDGDYVNFTLTLKWPLSEFESLVQFVRRERPKDPDGNPTEGDTTPCTDEETASD